MRANFQTLYSTKMAWARVDAFLLSLLDAIGAYGGLKHGRTFLLDTLVVFLSR